MTMLIKTTQDIKNILCKRPLGLVPTMGALHAGHVSLIKEMKEKCESSIVSIFVNPLQFSQDEDFEKYPRDLPGDLAICEKNDVDFVFVPDQKEIYSSDYSGIITPPKNLADILCGKTRKNHFAGVVTVVKRFFDLIKPDFAFFGKKDLQQLYVINWLVKEFNLPIIVISCPIVREQNGLAYSSRNNYLTKAQREVAARLYESLKLAKQNAHSGVFKVSEVILESLVFLSQFKDIKVEYFEARDKRDLSKIEDEYKKGDFYFLLAANVSDVRLIDNIEV